jgi:aspartate 1-decarboxylase
MSFGWGSTQRPLVVASRGDHAAGHHEVEIHGATVTRAVIDLILITYAHMDERDLRDFTLTIARVDAGNRVREQAAIA